MGSFRIEQVKCEEHELVAEFSVVRWRHANVMCVFGGFLENAKEMFSLGFDQGLGEEGNECFIFGRSLPAQLRVAGLHLDNLIKHVLPGAAAKQADQNASDKPWPG